ncbi:efflux RND transporter periplasmic adaptor subunit [Agromyces sp. NPDC055520]
MPGGPYGRATRRRSAVGVWRKWIFPTIRIVLVAVIAIALAKLAFFPDRAEADAETAVPTGSVVEPQVAVARGTIANEVVLTGTVNADASAPVKATGTGAVDEVFVTAGQQVAAGQKLYDIKVQDEVEPTETLGPDGLPSMTMPKASFHFEKVLAPSAGVLASLDVIEGQPVATGEVTGQVAPPSFNVTATLSPEQQYRLTSAPTEALVTIAGGPAPFTCGGLVISTPLSGASGGTGGAGAGATGAAGGGGAEASGGTTVRCAVPGDVRVFPGLSAQVKISAGSAADVLVVPITSVGGGAETGVVWLVTADGERVEQPVRLGLSDGTQVEVVEGVAEGDQVLQFVPGAPGETGREGCVQSPDGMMMCGTLTQ